MTTAIQPANTATLIERLRPIVGTAGMLTEASDLMVYECDGFTIEKTPPQVVVFPTSTDQIVQIVRLCNELNVPFLARGAGTSLAGGCVPVGGGGDDWPRPHEKDSRSGL